MFETPALPHNELTIRLLLADDHILFCDGLVLQLAHAQTNIEVVGQVHRGGDVLEAVHQFQPDVVLLDINLPGQSGIACAQQLVINFPAVKVVMLTMYDYRKIIDECRSIGVMGYLLKHERIETIIQIIQLVQRGVRCFAEQPDARRHSDDPFVRQFKLTPTEVKIIRLICQGLSTPKIAGQLFISEETVKSHRKNIYRKLAITHLTQLLTFAREQGIT